MGNHATTVTDTMYLPNQNDSGEHDWQTRLFFFLMKKVRDNLPAVLKAFTFEFVFKTWGIVMATVPQVATGKNASPVSSPVSTFMAYICKMLIVALSNVTTTHHASHGVQSNEERKGAKKNKKNPKTLSWSPNGGWRRLIFGC